MKKLCVFLAALLWGASHSAPYPQFSLNNVQATHKNLIPFGSGMLVKTQEDEYFFVKGKGRKGDFGSTIHFSKNSSYPLDRNYFTPYSSEISSIPKSLSSFVLKFKKRTVFLSPEIHGFIQSLVLGDTDSLGSTLLKAFKTLGIFHLLVVSGLHVSFLSTLSLRAIFLPFQIIYCVCFMNPRSWYILGFTLQILSTVFVFCYAIAIDFPCSIQRAVLLFALDQITKVFAVDLTVRNRIAIALCLQTIFFAFDFFSVGSVLSWLTYLTVYGFVNGETKGWKDLVKCQLALCLFIGAILGQLSLIGFFLNLIVIPLFPCVGIWILPLILGEFFPKSLISVGQLVETVFLQSMKFLSSVVEDLPFLYFEIGEQFVLRGFSFLLALGCMISLLKKRRTEQDF